MRIKKFESFTEKLTFSSVKPTDLAWLDREQIVDIISNTFESKVVSHDPTWTIVESKWHLIGKEDELERRGLSKLIGKEFKIFFILFPEDYLIIRGSSKEQISEFVTYAKGKNSSIVDTKDDYTNGNSFSTILRGRKFYNILWSFYPIPKGKDSIHKDGEIYSLKSMGCDGDPTIRINNIDYFSDLLIGTDVEMMEDLKSEYPDDDYVTRLQKSISKKLKGNE